MRDAGRTVLMLDDPGGEPLDHCQLLMPAGLEHGRTTRVIVQHSPCSIVLSNF
jgi:hypothetical protein